MVRVGDLGEDPRRDVVWETRDYGGAAVTGGIHRDSMFGCVSTLPRRVCIAVLVSLFLLFGD